MATDTNVSILLDLEPLASKDARRDLDAIRSLSDQFPGATLPEIAKLVTKFKDAYTASVPGVVEEAKRAVETSRLPESLRASVKKLNTTDLKAVGRKLGLALDGGKDEMLRAFAAWIESGGTACPKTRAELAAEAAQTYVQRARPLMEKVDEAAANEFRTILDEAYKDKALGKEGLEAFLDGLDIPVSGTKSQLKKKATEYVNRLAVTYVQTRA